MARRQSPIPTSALFGPTGCTLHRTQRREAPMTVQACDPLRDLLADVLARLSVLEARAGVAASPPHGAAGRAATAADAVAAAVATPRAAGAVAPAPVKALSLRNLKEAGEGPAVKAYEDYVDDSVAGFADACDALGGLQTMGAAVVSAFEGIRPVVSLASKSQKPEDDLAAALTPLLQQTQDAVKQVRELRLDRQYDPHQKAVTEALACLSWVLMSPLPVPFVRETLGSAEYWTNRIRKEYRGKNEKQVEFCDALKKMINGLVAYIEEYHKTGLTFNPKGLSFKETVIRMSDEPDDVDVAHTMSPGGKKHQTLGVTAAPNMLGLIGELSKKRTEDGSSAATGLKHVSKDMQTWRKEYKRDDEAKPAAAPKPVAPAKTPQKKKLKGLPVFEYQDRGFKWVVENHTSESVLRESHENGILTITISDPKQQVYIYNCDGITVKIIGKFKSLALDQCNACSVIYDDLISSTEVVNCKRIQLQVNGMSPVFTIDKTTNIIVYLMSKEVLEMATFTTSLSSEMNVSFPDGDDQKEVAIPEQFVHKLSAGRVTSEVSDLYH